jgi:acyl-coenzyme A thioesterase PaaI-like protein
VHVASLQRLAYGRHAGVTDRQWRLVPPDSQAETLHDGASLTVLRTAASAAAYVNRGEIRLALGVAEADHVRAGLERAVDLGHSALVGERQGKHAHHVVDDDHPARAVHRDARIDLHAVPAALLDHGQVQPA